MRSSSERRSFVRQCVTLGADLFHRAVRRRLVGLASESAFWLSLALIPLAALCGMIGARLALSSGIGLAPLFRAVPAEAREWLNLELARVASYNHGRVAPLAALVFVWLASSGVHGLFDAFEASTDSAPRP